MLAQQVRALQNENLCLRQALEELSQKMEQNQTVKPKSCQYCKHFIQHYMKGGTINTFDFVKIPFGHCTVGVPVKKGGKIHPKPDETCQYFEIGTEDMKMQ